MQPRTFARSHRTAAVRGALSAALLLLVPIAASAQHEHEEEDHRRDEDHRRGEEHRHGDGHRHGALHFTHPIIAESVSPDTKIRFDHQFFEFSDDEQEHSAVLEAEYAFAPVFSVELGLPYSYTESAVGNLEVLLKFANHAFAEAGVLLGYGVEFGFPTNGDPEHHEDDPGVPEAVAPAASTERSPAPGRSPSRGRTRSQAMFPIVAAFSGGGGGGVEGTLGTDEWEVSPRS